MSQESVFCVCGVDHHTFPVGQRDPRRESTSRARTLPTAHLQYNRTTHYRENKSRLRFTEQLCRSPRPQDLSSASFFDAALRRQKSVQTQENKAVALGIPACCVEQEHLTARDKANRVLRFCGSVFFSRAGAATCESRDTEPSDWT